MASGRVEPPWALWRPGKGGPWPFGARERGRNPTCNPSNFEKENTCNLLNSEGLQVGLRPPSGAPKGKLRALLSPAGALPPGAKGPGALPLPGRQRARASSTQAPGGQGALHLPGRQRARGVPIPQTPKGCGPRRYRARGALAEGAPLEPWPRPRVMVGLGGPQWLGAWPWCA